MNKKVIGAMFVFLLALVGSVYFLRSQKVETIKIVTSFPMREISVGKNTVNGITLALEEAGYKAGKYKIELVVKDGADAAGKWSTDIEKNIATKAVDDPDVMVYIGTYNSGSAKVSIPITNEGGLVQISPGNTWPGLTQTGFLPGEPGIFYPTGVRNYFRVVPNDSLQSSVATLWAKELGAKSLYILNDGSPPAKEEVLMAKKAEELGIKVVGRTELQNTPISIAGALKEVKDLKPDTIMYAGITPDTGIIPFIKGLREQNKNIKFIGVDGIYDQAFIDQGGSAAEGVFLTSLGLPTDQFTGKGKEFVDRYKTRFKEEPDVFSAFGYEAAKVALLAIEKAGVKDRAKILNEVANTKDYDGLFGKWSFDQNGDTTLPLISGNIIKDGKFVFEKMLNK